MSERDVGYSLENARRFKWSSISGQLNPERVAHLDKHLIGRSVLDAGCGGGGYTEFLAARGFDVTGLDYHTEFLPSRDDDTRRGTYVQGDITAMPFPEKHFDTTVCYDVLEHVDDSVALAELCRVTRQRLILAVPAHDDGVVGFNFTFAHYQDLTHLRTYTEKSLTQLLASAGLAKFHVFPELPLDFSGLASNHLVVPDGSAAWRKLLRRVLHAGLRQFLARARFQLVYTGWVAIIDLK